MPTSMDSAAEVAEAVRFRRALRGGPRQTRQLLLAAFIACLLLGLAIIEDALACAVGLLFLAPLGVGYPFIPRQP